MRCLVRDANRVRTRSWSEHVAIVEGDVFDASSVKRSLAEIDYAYYLIHSLGSGSDFADQDRQAARIFSKSVA